MNDNKISSIDIQWRLFFNGENHQILSNILAAIFNDFLITSLKYKIILDTPENQQILKRIDEDDISHTAKLADTFFETKFFNRAGNKIKCNLNSAFKKFQKDPSQMLSINQLNELKLDIHRSGQFETISKIILQARNINAHWHAPIEDAGNAALVSGSILRLLELFPLENFDDDKLEKLRNLASNLISTIAMINISENSDDKLTPNLVNETQNDDLNNIELIPEENESEDVTSQLDDLNDNEIELPDINFNPSNTKEQKRQLLMKLSYDLLSDERLVEYDIKRQKSILSRQSIKEFLELQTFDIETISSSLTISHLMKVNKNSIEKQIEYYGPQIIQIISEFSDASD